MTLPVTIPNTFANATTSIPLANLDANFVTIYDAVNGIGNGAEALANVNISGGNVNVSTVTVNSNNISADNSLGFRNRIINGDMRIAQRGTAAVTATGSYPVDRFFAFNSSDAAFSAQQDSSAPTGFINSFKYTTTTADGTLTTTQNSTVGQNIEGTNVADFGWGTASAKTITLSFWVRSSLTGTFGGALRNSASDRSYPFTYSISSADTWEYKTVTIAGDTSGTWLTTTGVGIRITFSLGAGPDRSGTAGAWAAGNLISATGATSVIGTLNATWYITGVQLEVGSVATPFERIDYGRQLIQCQRYLPAMAYDGGSNPYLGAGMAYSNTAAFYTVSFPVTPRVPPTGLTVSAASHFGGFLADTNTSNATAVNFSGANNHSAFVQLTGMSGLVAGNSTLIYMSNSSAQMLFTGCDL